MAQLTIPITVDWEGIKDRIGNDFVEVVRCKDCKHYMDTKPYASCEVLNAMAMDKDDFCSYGERRDDAEVH